MPDNNAVNSKRVVILEEFTGASCVNCPAGIAQSKAILDKYPDNVVLIGVHSKFLAQPATAGQVDLRTKDAQDIEDFLGSWLAKPEAAINRLFDNPSQSFRIGRPDTWIIYVEDELKKAPQADLKISTNYDDASRLLTVKLDVTGLENITSPVHLHCGITESEIVADQLNNTTPSKLVGFVHEHVLRKMLTPIPGEKISDKLSAGQKIENLEYSFILPQDSILWNPANCNVFAYVSLDENQKYILQGAEAKVK